MKILLYLTVAFIFHVSWLNAAQAQQPEDNLKNIVSNITDDLVEKCDIKRDQTSVEEFFRRRYKKRHKKRTEDYMKNQDSAINTLKRNLLKSLVDQNVPVGPSIDIDAISWPKIYRAIYSTKPEGDKGVATQIEHGSKQQVVNPNFLPNSGITQLTYFAPNNIRRNLLRLQCGKLLTEGAKGDFDIRFARFFEVHASANLQKKVAADTSYTILRGRFENPYIDLLLHPKRADIGTFAPLLTAWHHGTLESDLKGEPAGRVLAWMNAILVHSFDNAETLSKWQRAGELGTGFGIPFLKATVAGNIEQQKGINTLYAGQNFRIFPEAINNKEAFGFYPLTSPKDILDSWKEQRINTNVEGITLKNNSPGIVEVDFGPVTPSNDYSVDIYWLPPEKDVLLPFLKPEIDYLKTEDPKDGLRRYNIRFDPNPRFFNTDHQSTEYKAIFKLRYMHPRAYSGNKVYLERSYTVPIMVETGPRLTGKDYPKLIAPTHMDDFSTSWDIEFEAQNISEEARLSVDTLKCKEPHGWLDNSNNAPLRDNIIDGRIENREGSFKVFKLTITDYAETFQGLISETSRPRCHLEVVLNIGNKQKKSFRTYLEFPQPEAAISTDIEDTKTLISEPE